MMPSTPATYTNCRCEEDILFAVGVSLRPVEIGLFRSPEPRTPEVDTLEERLSYSGLRATRPRIIMEVMVEMLPGHEPRDVGWASHLSGTPVACQSHAGDGRICAVHAQRAR
jgi:hypothetical protein